MDSRGGGAGARRCADTAWLSIPLNGFTTVHNWGGLLTTVLKLSIPLNGFRGDNRGLRRQAEVKHLSIPLNGFRYRLLARLLRWRMSFQFH